MQSILLILDSEAQQDEISAKATQLESSTARTRARCSEKPRLKSSPHHLGQTTKGPRPLDSSPVKIIELDPLGSKIL